MAAARSAGDGAGTARGNTRAASRRGASRLGASRKGAVCDSHVAQSALFRHVAARETRGATPRQPAGHYGKWLNWANALEQPPARLRGGVAPGSAGVGLGPDRTERRTLRVGPVASVFVVYEGWRGLSGCRVLLLSGGMPPERTLLCPYPTTPWRIRQAPPS